MVDLSHHDKAVLNCIFNPSLPLTEAYDEELNSTIQDVEEETEEILNAKELEIEAINRAEKGDLENALNILNEALNIAPQKASLYNNRAQIYQLKFMENGNYQNDFYFLNLNSFLEAFLDLTKAIELARNNQKRTLCQSLCQRGLLYRKREQNDSARDDFDEASKLGSQFAKSQLVELNPYAALCNQMLRKVMNDLK
ncbi:tetratricopeptide repeat protein 36 homolog isoform X1 [Onthophagus taurus]|uniref:tetratricopeptide repeat protein 36 homolog isoform X1 n=1 Tax=Onthophagus taurus TaxID=166361 RepID=UPI000C20E5BE|nr:tetratricopeptide repeat protein 36 homolog isoform X1 [Onthophagus taurus]